MTRRGTPRALVYIFLACLAGSVPLPAAQADSAWEKQHRFYLRMMMRKSLNKHTKGWRQLMANNQARALPILAKDYGRKSPDQEARQHVIVASTFSRGWKQNEAVAAIQAWRQYNARVEDAWLWHRSLRLRSQLGSVEAAREAEQSAPSLHLQLAALRAMADAEDPTTLEALARRLAAFKDRASAWRGEQSLVLEVVGRSLAALAKLKDEEAWRDVARTALQHMANRNVPRRTKYVLARCMASVLGGDPTDLDAESWVREIMAGGSGAGAKDDHYAGPSFGGLRAAGDRIVYVIDFSDSMLTPIDPELRKRLSAVVTGPQGSRKREPQIPWHEIETRFDLARELLKASLADLDKERHFAVVWVGDEAGLLKATPKLVKATPKRIKSAIRELDAIEPGPVGVYTQFKFGSLRGETNLHGGLRLAYRLTGRKLLGDFSYVDPKAREEGAQSIFVLSDGKPTQDDWTMIDQNDGDGAVTDSESGTPAQATETLRYPGPYGYWPYDYIPDDLARRNLFRHVEVNCIGLGEADMSLLWAMADAGLGQATVLGRKPRKKAR